MSKKNVPYGKLWCNECGESFHCVKLDKYDPDAEPNATWFELLEQYKNEAWTAFPNNDPAIKGAELWCPGCGSVYTDIHNRITWHNQSGKYLGKGKAKFRAIYNKTYLTAEERKKKNNKKKKEALNSYEQEQEQYQD